MTQTLDSYWNSDDEDAAAVRCSLYLRPSSPPPLPLSAFHPSLISLTLAALKPAAEWYCPLFAEHGRFSSLSRPLCQFCLPPFCHCFTSEASTPSSFFLPLMVSLSWSLASCSDILVSHKSLIFFPDRQISMLGFKLQNNRDTFIRHFGHLSWNVES